MDVRKRVQQDLIYSSTAVPNLLAPGFSCLRQDEIMRSVSSWLRTCGGGFMLISIPQLQFCELIIMLSEALVQSSRILEQLQLQDFKKVINYSHNVLVNIENQMKLNEFIQIEEEKGDHITQITLALIRSLSKYRANPKDFDHDLSLLLMSPERTHYLKEKIQNNLHEIRKVVYHQDYDQTHSLISLGWRFESQIASKSQKNTFKPNIRVSISHKADQSDSQQKNIAFNCDFANLKNLHSSLLEAMKMHHSSKFKAARFSSI